MPAYEYFPLVPEGSEIRLLKLLPAQLWKPIRIHLTSHAFSKESLPRYEALSYVWGSSENPTLIEILKAGLHPYESSAIEIGQNLSSKIVHLRREKHPRTL